MSVDRNTTLAIVWQCENILIIILFINSIISNNIQIQFLY